MELKFIEKPTSADISAIEKWKSFFQVQLPDDLLELVTETDGPILYDSNRDAEFQFLSLKSAVEYYEDYLFSTYMKEAIPLCMDGNGNFAIYMKTSEQPLTIYLVSSSDLEWDSSVAIGNKLEDLFKIRIEDKINESI